jgi:hypothetical protein
MNTSYLLQAFPSNGYRGLDKREYFAALAMQGLLANPEIANGLVRQYEIANDAVRVADAVLARLNVVEEE